MTQMTFFPFGSFWDGKSSKESTPGPLSNEQFSCWTFDMTPLCESLGDPTSQAKPPGKLTYPLKRDGLKRGNFTFQPSNIKGYVSFQRGFDICILSFGRCICVTIPKDCKYKFVVQKFTRLYWVYPCSIDN